MDIHVMQLAILQYLSVNKHIKFISTDSITHNFSCTDVNNNLQLSYLSWAKCCITLLTNMKGLECTATESLEYRVILVFQLKSSLKTCIRACFNNHVTSHVTDKIDE